MDRGAIRSIAKPKSPKQQGFSTSDSFRLTNGTKKEYFDMEQNKNTQIIA
jgi:hypothetical protein